MNSTEPQVEPRYHYPKVLTWVTEFVTEFMSKFDPSHDIHHVLRVKNLSLKLAQTFPSQPPIDLELVELTALLHDVNDPKYLTEKNPISIPHLLIGLGYPEPKSQLVAKLVERVGYKKELFYLQSKQVDQLREQCRELWCVQDADKLDALGAIGILRCAAFASHQNHVLIDAEMDGTRRADKLGKTAVGHVEQKLVLLQNSLKVELSKSLARERHNFLLAFLQRAYQELEEGS